MRRSMARIQKFFEPGNYTILSERGVFFVIEAKNQNVFKTFLTYAVPCILGMFLTSFIIVVDGIFVGRVVGERGLAAINLTLPVLYTLLAVSIMIGVGGVTLAARCLGERNAPRAHSFFTTAIGVSALFQLAALIVLFLFQDPIIALLNAKGIVAGYVRDYLGIMKYFYGLMMLNLTFTMFIRSEGKPQLARCSGSPGTSSTSGWTISSS
jgi:Na+-driven multidrug efflux pump